MKRKNSISWLNRYTVLSVFLLVISAGWIWLSRVQASSLSQDDISAPRRGFRAPEFILASNTGDQLNLADLKGKVLLINFWTSWCPPCRAEMPAIQSVYEDYQDDGLVVLGINATNQDNYIDAMQLIDDNQFSFPILFDVNGDVSQQYNVRSFPTSYFVDHEGIIQDVVIGGPMAEALLRTRVERLLDGLK